MTTSPPTSTPDLITAKVIAAYATARLRIDTLTESVVPLQRLIGAWISRR